MPTFGNKTFTFCVLHSTKVESKRAKENVTTMENTTPNDLLGEAKESHSSRSQVTTVKKKKGAKFDECTILFPKHGKIEK